MPSTTVAFRPFNVDKSPEVVERFLLEFSRGSDLLPSAKLELDSRNADKVRCLNRHDMTVHKQS